MNVSADDAIEVAQEAVTIIWERDTCGACVLNSNEVWSAVSTMAYEIARQVRRRVWDAKKYVYFDQTAGDDPDSDARLAIGIWGHVAPDQIDACFLSEVCDAIALLPNKHRVIMGMLARGYNAPDISSELRLPIHTIFARIKDARAFLYHNDLLGTAIANRQQKC